MFTRFAGYSLAFLALALSGCSTMSADECISSDWYAIGFEDGARGYTADAMSNRRQACAKHGVVADFQSYREGRKEGLKEFCQPQRGFNLGAGGGRYYGVCPANLEEDFLHAYRTGSQLHTLRSNVNNANYQISAREQAIANIESSIRGKQAQLIADETAIQDRVLILADLQKLNERVGELENEIEVLVEERVIYELELAEYEQVLADSGY